MICVQTCKSLSKDIRRCLSDIILFPGVNEQDFIDLIKETPAGAFDRKLLWQEYHAIKDPHATFSIYIKANKVIISQKKTLKNK